MNYFTTFFQWTEQNIFESSDNNLRPLISTFYKARNLLCLPAVEVLSFKYRCQTSQIPRCMSTIYIYIYSEHTILSITWSELPPSSQQNQWKSEFRTLQTSWPLGQKNLKDFRVQSYISFCIFYKITCSCTVRLTCLYKVSTARYTKSHPSAHTNNSWSGLSWSHFSKNCWSRYQVRLCSFTLLCCSSSLPHPS